MPSPTSKKIALKSVKTMPSKMHSHRDGHGPHWHAVLWIAVLAIVFSASTITLSAMAQGTSQGYAKNSEGILRAVSDLRKDVREIGGRVMRIENSLKAAEISATTTK